MDEFLKRGILCIILEAATLILEGASLHLLNKYSKPRRDDADLKRWRYG
jgi:hypothetical protein